MRFSRIGMAVCVLVAVPQGALASELTITNATGKSVACAFAPACMVSATDTYGVFKLFGNGGVGRLLTRTYPGLPGAPAAGLTGYSLKLDMTEATALGSANCVERLVVDVGPVASLKYGPGGASGEVFVVEGGSIGLASVTQNGGRITFNFAKPICPVIGSKPGQDSLYFGFASKNAPVPGKGQIIATLEGTSVEVRLPKH